VYPAFVVLDRYIKQRPSDSTALHLFSLVCELLDQPDVATRYISRAIMLLEAEYEATEDAIVERHYTIANLNLGRLRLASGEYGEALLPYETVLGLLAENDTEEGLRLRTQAHLGSGLANFHLGQLENAVSDLENAIQLVGNNANIRRQLTVLLAKFLWAIGSEELRENATTQLLEW
jgi:superkiller protein 3